MATLRESLVIDVIIEIIQDEWSENQTLANYIDEHRGWIITRARAKYKKIHEEMREDKLNG